MELLPGIFCLVDLSFSETPIFLLVCCMTHLWIICLTIEFALMIDTPLFLRWFKAAVCWYLVHCQMRADSYSMLILVRPNLLLTKHFPKKTNPFFVVKKNFLKQNSFLLLWLLLIFVSLALSTVALFTGSFTELAYDALAPWKKKKITSGNLFLFCFVRFKCCFCL